VTEFLPGNQQQAFTVTGIPKSQALTWSVTHAGATRSVTVSGTLEQECNAPPQPPTPIGLFACVTPKGSTYDVTFGYDNENPVAVSVPVGIANGVLPAPVRRGQPELFSPGRVNNAFTVENVPASRRIVWRVAHDGTTLLVVSDSHPVRCGSGSSNIPVRVFPLCVLKKGKTYDAAFGYLNPGTATIRVRRGEQNAVSPEEHAGNQTEVFRPGLTAASFAVRGVPLDQSVAWTVETNGQVETATATASTADCKSVAVGGSDLSVTKAARPTVAAVGDRVQYSIAVRNAGTILATHVVAVDRPLGSLLEVVSATTSQGSCAVQASGQVICTLGTLGPAQIVHILIAGRAVGVGSSRNTVKVTSVPGDADPSNNVASAVVTIGPSNGSGPVPSFTG
jgi:uncharacterized repeat protein (TIGR01451 family)